MYDDIHVSDTVSGHSGIMDSISYSNLRVKLRSMIDVGDERSDRIRHLHLNFCQYWRLLTSILCDQGQIKRRSESDDDAF